MNIIEDVKCICNKLDNIQSSIDELSNKLSMLELQEQDLLHLIENSTLKTNQCYRIIKEIRKCRLERRKVRCVIQLETKPVKNFTQFTLSMCYTVN